MIASAFLSALVLAGVARSAAPTVPIIEMTYPPPRGVASVDTHTIAPCQGFAVGGRTPFPISSGASIALNLTRDAKNVHIRYTNLADPKSNDDFSPLSTNITQAYRGSRCVDQPDFAARGLKVGDDVTMQLWYTSGPQNTTFYECADVTLVENSAYVSTDHFCQNVTLSTQTRGNANPALSSIAAASASASASLAAAGSTTSNTGGAGRSAVVGGGLGVAVMGAVAMLL